MWEVEPDPAVRRRKMNKFRDEFDVKIREHTRFMADHLPICRDPKGTISISARAVVTIQDAVETMVNQVNWYHERVKLIEEELDKLKDAAGTTTTRRLSEG